MASTEQILDAYHCGADYSEEIKRREILESLGIEPSGEHRTDDTVFGVPFVYCGSHLRTHATGWCTVGIGNKLPLRSQEREAAHAESKALGLRQYGAPEECVRCAKLLDSTERDGWCGVVKNGMKEKHQFSRVRNF